MMKWNKDEDGLSDYPIRMIIQSEFIISFLGEHSDQIDRFDVRAHLDSVPAEKKGDNDIDAEFEKDELSEVMYERYREIIHNDFRGLGIELRHLLCNTSIM